MFLSLPRRFCGCSAGVDCVNFVSSLGNVRVSIYDIDRLSTFGWPKEIKAKLHMSHFAISRNTELCTESVPQNEGLRKIEVVTRMLQIMKMS